MTIEYRSDGKVTGKTWRHAVFLSTDVSVCLRPGSASYVEYVMEVNLKSDAQIHAGTLTILCRAFQLVMPPPSSHATAHRACCAPRRVLYIGLRKMPCIGTVHVGSG